MRQWPPNIASTPLGQILRHSALKEKKSRDSDRLALDTDGRQFQSETRALSSGDFRKQSQRGNQAQFQGKVHQYHDQEEKSPQTVTWWKNRFRFKSAAIVSVQVQFGVDREARQAEVICHSVSLGESRGVSGSPGKSYGVSGSLAESDPSRRVAMKCGQASRVISVLTIDYCPKKAALSTSGHKIKFEQGFPVFEAATSRQWWPRRRNNHGVCEDGSLPWDQ
ncbi:hypothetical protein EGW08_001601 [Elysia chlorotica]|uniref:Uncharacterized protein n=1 Tax=Elysia chlorotica TaxID=188477 RepID=A0A433U9T3_ELYCH|nr:hypothetical protein EGW08_001601 [Elysia chlorotica]